MESSSRNPVPTTFSGTNPIFIQLENDVTRYVQISFAKQVVVAGLSIETLESMALKSFTLSYAGKRIQDPNGISKVPQLFGSSSMVRHSTSIFNFNRLLFQSIKYNQEIKVEIHHPASVCLDI